MNSVLVFRKGGTPQKRQNAAGGGGGEPNVHLDTGVQARKRRSRILDRRSGWTNAMFGTDGYVFVSTKKILHHNDQKAKKTMKKLRFDLVWDVLRNS